MKIFGYEIVEVRKFIAAAIGGAVSIATQVLAMGDVVPPGVANWATVIVAIGTAAGVFGTPNDRKDPPTDVEETVKAAPKRRPVI